MSRGKNQTQKNRKNKNNLALTKGFQIKFVVRQPT